MTDPTAEVTLADIEAAREVLAEVTVRTPMERVALALDRRRR